MLPRLTMRDDIHKNAPVSLGWRRLIRAAARNADWSEIVGARAQGAVGGELRRDLDETLVAEVVEATKSPQRNLFGTSELLQDLARGRVLSEMERRFLDHLNRLGRESFDCTAVRAAISQTIVDRIRATLREIEGHVAQSHPASRAELMRRLRVGVGQVAPADLAERLLRGERTPAPAPAVRPINLDGDDLRKSSTKR